jgi:phosphoglycolate phosphatase-like HAD superfamily hydrolase
MDVPHRLILWDVDGTLVMAGSAAQRAFDLAVASAVGRDPVGHGVRMSGKTDPQIALEIMAALDMAEDEAHRFLPAVLEGLIRELEAAEDTIRQHGRVLPGVRGLLPKLHRPPHIVQSLLTGNLAPNAALKLRAFGLDRWVDLEVGAYGSDDRDRTVLVPIAMAKTEERYGYRFEPQQVWVVGDTPRDLECARAARARCLLVGTGRHGFEELEGLGADAVLRDLTNVSSVYALLVGGDD